MGGLLDYIFSTLDIESLGRQKATEYLRYLEEIAPQLRSAKDREKFMGFQARLTQRLRDIGSGPAGGL